MFAHRFCAHQLVLLPENRLAFVFFNLHHFWTDRPRSKGKFAEQEPRGYEECVVRHMRGSPILSNKSGKMTR